MLCLHNPHTTDHWVALTPLSLQVTPGSSATHLFRSVLTVLSNPKAWKVGIFMQRTPPPHVATAPPTAAANPPDLKAWRQHFAAVFVDGSGWLNLTAGVSAAALKQAQACALRTLRLLASVTPETFDATFLAQQPVAALCDYWYRVSVPSAGGAVLAGDQAAWRFVLDCACASACAYACACACISDCVGLQTATGMCMLVCHVIHQSRNGWLVCVHRAMEIKVQALASKALGSRAVSVRVFGRRTAQIKVKHGASGPEHEHILLGVQVRGEVAACASPRQKCGHLPAN